MASLAVLAWAGCFEEPPPQDPPEVGCVDLIIPDGTLETIPSPPIAQHFAFEWVEQFVILGGSTPSGLAGSEVTQEITLWPGAVGVGEPLGQVEQTVPLPAAGGSTRGIGTAELLEEGPLAPGNYTLHIRTDLPNSECQGCQCADAGWGEEELSFEVLPCSEICGDLQAIGLGVEGDLTETGDFEFVWQNAYLGDVCAGEIQPSTGNFTETITLDFETGQSSEVVRAANPLILGEPGEDRSIAISELSGQHPAGAYTLTLFLDAESDVFECPEDSDNNIVVLDVAVQP